MPNRRLQPYHRKMKTKPLSLSGSGGLTETVRAAIWCMRIRPRCKIRGHDVQQTTVWQDSSHSQQLSRGENMSPQSKRARILRRVLDFINHGDWEEGDGFLLFGSEAYDEHLGIEHEVREPDTYFDEFLRRLASEIKHVGGAVDIAKRISISPISSGFGEVDLRPFFDGISPDQRARIAHVISSVAEDLVQNPKPGTETIRNISDDIDASLAAEAIDQLENSYRRLVMLDEIKRPTTPFDGSEYLEEAHRCELAGQKIAAVVLCRAVLEAALINAIDQSGWIKQQMNQQHSRIEAMLLQARLIGLIDESRFEHALQIRDAGNAAIHNLLQFHHNFSDKVPGIIDNTRKILEDLFSPKLESSTNAGGL